MWCEVGQVFPLLGSVVGPGQKVLSLHKYTESSLRDCVSKTSLLFSVWGSCPV